MTVSTIDRPRLSPHVRLQWDPVRGKCVLLQPEGVLILNPTAAAILDLCDGRRSVREIVEHLGTTYNHVDEADVLHFLERLAQKRVLKTDGN